MKAIKVNAGIVPLGLPARLGAGVLLFLIGAALRAAPLPFSLRIRDARWNPLVVDKAVAPGITLDEVVTHLDASDLLLVYSSGGADRGDRSLSAFAHRLKDLFTAYQSAGVKETAAERIGFSGLDLRFELRNPRRRWDCDLFVFEEARAQWGVMYVKPWGTRSAEAAAFGLLQKAPPSTPGVVAMNPYRIRKTPLTTFPISLRIERNPRTGRIAGIVVAAVPADSETAQDGVAVGDAVIAINGRKVQDFAPGVTRDSDLGRIFLNRNPGDEVTLEILPIDSKKPFKVTLEVPNPDRPDSPFEGFRDLR